MFFDGIETDCLIVSERRRGDVPFDSLRFKLGDESSVGLEPSLFFGALGGFFCETVYRN